MGFIKEIRSRIPEKPDHIIVYDNMLFNRIEAEPDSSPIDAALEYIKENYPQSYVEVLINGLVKKEKDSLAISPPPADLDTSVHESHDYFVTCFDLIHSHSKRKLMHKQKADQQIWEDSKIKMVREVQNLKQLKKLKEDIEYDFVFNPDTSIRAKTAQGKLMYFNRKEEFIIRWSPVVMKYIENRLDHLKEFGEYKNEGTKKETSTSSKIKWNGNKTQLKEIIQALYLSEVIRDTETNKAASQRQLIEAFNKVFSMDIKHTDFSGDVLKYYDRHKRRFDNDFYVGELKGTFLDYLEELLIQDKDNRLD